MGVAPQVTAPGCDTDGGTGGLWAVMKNRADAQRVIEQSYTPIIKQNDSELAATCFDKALTLSSRMGAIFSDLPQNGIQLPDFASFGSGNPSDLFNTFASLGIKLVNGKPQGNTLANTYGSVINNTLTGYLQKPGAFTSSITKQFGATSTGALANLVTSINIFLTGPANSILNGAGGVGGGLNALTNVVSGVSSMAANFSISLNGPGGSFSLQGSLVSDFTSSPVFVAVTSVLSIMNSLNSVLGAAADAADKIQATVDYYAKFMTDLLSASSLLGGAGSSLSGMDWNTFSSSLGGGLPTLAGLTLPGFPGMTFPDPTKGCAFSEMMWSGGVSVNTTPGGPATATTTFAPGITRSGPDPGTPFFTFSDLMLNNPIAAGAGMNAVLSGTAANNAILNQAKDDSVTYLLSPGTSGLSFWNPVPVIPSGVSASVVLNMMP
jgi:hypothetical protein